MSLLQALFAKAGLPTDIGRLEREKAERIEAFKKLREEACKHVHIVKDSEDRLICDKCGEVFEEIH